MKKPTLLIAVMSLTIVAGCQACADSPVGKAESFQTVLDIARGIDQPHSTLVVMDDDDTLTMMSCPQQTDLETCQYLGGPAWFDWQNDLLKEMGQPRVANDFDELLTIAGLLLATNYMPYTADDVPTVLDELTAMGVRLLTETARGTDTLSATENQFKRLSTPNKAQPTLLAMMNANSPQFAGASGRPSPFQACPNEPTERLISFQQGVTYVSGQDKGTILKCLLDEHNAQAGVAPIKYVIFIDDTLKNVEQVAAAFEGSKNYEVHALHYIAMHAHKAALTKGDMARAYQRQAADRWNAIRDVLRGQLLNPAMP